MRRHLAILVVAWTWGATLANAGIEGNGGDAVRCRAASANAFEGSYSLDWLVTYRVSNGNSDVAPVDSWETSRDRLRAILRDKSPGLLASFDRFLAGLDNFTDLSAERVWIERPFGLVDLEDERLTSRLPANCYEIGEDRRPKIEQAVVRDRREDLLTYFFDSRIYDSWRGTAPLQFSFLMVHEWLWDLVSDAEKIRDVNRMLHSSLSEQYTPEQFNLALTRLGLALDPNPGFVPVCERSRTVRRLLEIQLGMTCQAMKADDLARVESLDFSSVAKGPLRAGDFSGLLGLRDISIDDFDLTDLEDGLFFNAPRLWRISLKGNRLTRINRKAFPPSMQLDYLVFDHNQVSSFDLAGLEIGFVGASDNQVRSVQDVKLGSTNGLRLENNPISSMEGGRWGGGLSILSFGGSDLSTFNCDMFPNLKQLSVQRPDEDVSGALDLSRRTFAGCPRLRALTLQVPGARVAPDALDDLRDLDSFTLWFSPRVALPAGLLRGLPELTKINLSSNDFDDSLADILPLHEIERLNLSDNRFVRLPAWFSRVEIGRRGYAIVWGAYNGQLDLFWNDRLSLATRAELEERFAYLADT